MGIYNILNSLTLDVLGHGLLDAHVKYNKLKIWKLWLYPVASYLVIYGFIFPDYDRNPNMIFRESSMFWKH